MWKGLVDLWSECVRACVRACVCREPGSVEGGAKQRGTADKPLCMHAPGWFCGGFGVGGGVRCVCLFC